ncbi:uncharacterized protein E5676_scaffold436G00360 [Cucumis melo var. makuwa]|uniref:Uncharacterized protein n=1 Tax=Cucumis melo var. makuwa TaxID=1194695 RepID=A0A5D3DR62_CUCMM|nr:uncharacterized protein E5676_scaffold436G00360 [Cucumis melo var. makuwa]
MEERLEGTEKEVLGLKEVMLELKKAVDQMANDMRKVFIGGEMSQYFRWVSDETQGKNE